MKMNNHTIINSKTYEIIDDNEIIEVDDNIAEAISLLNKKGYYTKACCGGHVKPPVYYKKTCKISEYEPSPGNFIISQDKDEYTYFCLDDFTGIYIKFISDYHFQSIPDGFIKTPVWCDETNDWSKTEMDGIEVIINYFDSGIHKDFNDIQNEINKYNKILLDWVKKLPAINERNDKNE